MQRGERVVEGRVLTVPLPPGSGPAPSPPHSSVSPLGMGHAQCLPQRRVSLCEPGYRTLSDLEQVVTFRQL